MKKAILIIFLFLCISAFCQNGIPQKYIDLVKQAEAYYQSKDYKKSGEAYSAAFKENSWKGTSNDRYNAACSWAMANVPDSALFNLMRIATRSMFADFERVTTDSDLDILHEDKRWKIFLDLVKANKEKAEANLNKPLTHQLDSIYIEDQKYRQQMDEVGQKYGWDSKEMRDLWKIANYHDSINLIKVKAILDKHGWLGSDVVGPQGNMTLFLVIQHSDQKTQEKYLPMMREAVKNGKAQSSSLALLEDRVALGQGKKQIYGSQIGRTQDGKNYVLPLEDPDNVDKRRAEVGLGPLNDYTMHWNFKWNPEEYKKENPK